MEPRKISILLGPSRLISSDVGCWFMSKHPSRYKPHATHNRGIVFKIFYFFDDIFVFFQNTSVECGDHLKCPFSRVIYIPNGCLLDVLQNTYCSFMFLNTTTMTTIKHDGCYWFNIWTAIDCSSSTPFFFWIVSYCKRRHRVSLLTIIFDSGAGRGRGKHMWV